MAYAQSADPEELQVLDTFLPTQLVVRASSPNLAPRHTEGSLKVTLSLRLHHTQQSSTQSHIPVLASQLGSERTTPDLPEFGLGLS